MEQDIKQRVKLTMKELEISVNALSEFRQLTRSTINDQINGNSKIGVATIEALLAYRPDLSAEWLLRGAGDMLLTDKPAEIAIDNSNFGHHNNTNIGGTQMNSDSVYREALVTSLREQIDDLRKDKENLYQLLFKK